MALTPLRTILYLMSCNRGSAEATLRGLPSGRFGPVQKTSAELAARGQTMESRFSGDDCSVHKSCWPGYVGEETRRKLRPPVFTSEYQLSLISFQILQRVEAVGLVQSESECLT
jgi:hypothetical protein